MRNSFKLINLDLCGCGCAFCKPTWEASHTSFHLWGGVGWGRYHSPEERNTSMCMKMDLEHRSTEGWSKNIEAAWTTDAHEVRRANPRPQSPSLPFIWFSSTGNLLLVAAWPQVSTASNCQKAQRLANLPHPNRKATLQHTATAFNWFDWACGPIGHSGNAFHCSYQCSYLFASQRFPVKLSSGKPNRLR